MINPNSLVSDAGGQNDNKKNFTLLWEVAK